MTLLDEIQTGPLAEELAPHVAIRHDAMVLAETFTSFTPAANGDNIKLTPQITATHT